jgi:SAM-dependent methyltransferase
VNLQHLPAVVPPEGEPPQDIGTGHPMRDVTERVAADSSAWTPELAEFVRGIFDEAAPGWEAQIATESDAATADALARGGPLPGPVLELGAGTGAGTRRLHADGQEVVAGDLSTEMLSRLDPAIARRVRLDASRLPFPDATFGTVVCVNMLLFRHEVERVLGPGGALVWVNSLGERTPIHLSAERLAEVLGDGWAVTASRAGWGTWAVARRA